MPKRIYIGIDSDISGIISSISGLGLDPGDEVVIIAPQGNLREDLAQRIERFFRDLVERGARFSFRYLRVDEENVPRIVRDILLDAADSRGELFFEVTGGSRPVMLAILISALLLKSRVAGIHTLSGTTGKRVDVPIPPLSPPSIDDKDRAVLSHLFEAGDTSMSEMNRRLGIPKATLSRRLRLLEKLGLVKRLSSKPARYRLTWRGLVTLLSTR